VVAIKSVVDPNKKQMPKESIRNVCRLQKQLVCLSHKKKSAVTRKRAKKQGVGGKPTNVKTFAANGGIINKNKPGNSGLYGRR
tara:strand:+ start:645 stop:893 length:249 start_codon:yes stop_codon:yes gene_type:complete